MVTGWWFWLLVLVSFVQIKYFLKYFKWKFGIKGFWIHACLSNSSDKICVASLVSVSFDLVVKKWMEKITQAFCTKIFMEYYKAEIHHIFFSPDISDWNLSTYFFLIRNSKSTHTSKQSDSLVQLWLSLSPSSSF